MGLVAYVLLASKWHLSKKRPLPPKPKAKVNFSASNLVETMSSQAGIFLAKSGVCSSDTKNFQDVTKYII